MHLAHSELGPLGRALREWWGVAVVDGTLRLTPGNSPLSMFLPQYKRENGLRMGPVLGRDLPLTAHPRPGREAAFFPG